MLTTSTTCILVAMATQCSDGFDDAGAICVAMLVGGGYYLGWCYLVLTITLFWLMLMLTTIGTCVLVAMVTLFRWVVNVDD